ncbi:hypothetical protein RI129_002994 [Pyrocoelia pectoralis]|uniref:Fatty acid 2-hydroxylase n=1 Tax=Pyrocoelia pectoralis TaxID=417401 RepID=A0AAN7VHF2_9COLE
MREMEENDFFIEGNGSHYNVVNFLKNHPGGCNYVEFSKTQDVISRMEKTHHSKSAFYLLREYKVGGRDEANNNGDEDLEKLVDWNRGMLSQVGNLGNRYMEWVTSPVDRKLKLFANPFIECFSITPWYVVPIVWVPILFYIIYCGILDYIDVTLDRCPIVPTISFVCLGILLWTIFEYCLHRWVFHIEPSGSSKLLIYFHFAIHGLHHKVPFDSTRLVFPPAPAALIAYVAYNLMKLIFPSSILLLLFGGALLGYVIYDMIHFYLHYGAPNEGTILYTMKRHHNQHHFAHHDKGFGISNLFWDRIFGTLILLRKLAFGIKWKNPIKTS